MWTNGELQLSTMVTQAQIPTLSGGGARSSHSIAMSEPKFSPSPLEHPVFLWLDSLSFKVFKACRSSPCTKRMGKTTACLKLIHVRFHQICADIFTHFLVGFNQIDLPQYSSYEMLRQQLLMAINEGGEGFGFA